MAIGGLDIGTSGCKFVAYDLEGHALCTFQRSYREYGTGGIREVEPEEVWQAILFVLTEAAAKCPEKIEGFAVTTLGESAVPLDKAGRVLYRSMVTGDRRGIDEKEELVEKFGVEKLVRITGIPPSEMYSLPKFLWINKNTDVFENTKYLLFYEDFAAYRLTGKRMVSYSSASRTMAFDIGRKKWSEELLNAVGLTVGQMSEPVPSGTVIGKITKEIAYKTGLDESTTIVTGGHDQVCAALGVGVLEKGSADSSMGTCEVLATMIDKSDDYKYMVENELACVPYVMDDTYLTYIVMTSGSVLMNWFVETFLPSEFIRGAWKRNDFFRLFDVRAKNEPTSMLVIPNFGSSGNPKVDYDSKGNIFGLTIHTKLHQIYRAIKEGMAYHMRLCIETLKPLGIDVGKITAVGGGSKSDLTLQIRADVLGSEIGRLENNEAGTLGCMMLTGVALGKYASLEEAVAQTVRIRNYYTPTEENRAFYDERFEQYKKLYYMLRDMK